MRAGEIDHQGYVSLQGKLRSSREAQFGLRKGPATQEPRICIDNGPIVKLPELAIVGLNEGRRAEATSVTERAGAGALDYSVRPYALDAGQQRGSARISTSRCDEVGDLCLRRLVPNFWEDNEQL